MRKIEIGSYIQLTDYTRFYINELFSVFDGKVIFTKYKGKIYNINGVFLSEKIYNEKDLLLLVLRKTFKMEFYTSGSIANTLPTECIGKNPSGWEIDGEIIEDYYQWVNDFEATHKVFGNVWGNFEEVVYADTEEGYKHFVENHPPEEWDYSLLPEE